MPEILLERVTVPPNATVPPPDNPDPASTLMEESASMLFVTPSAGMLIVPVLLIGPPVSPAPVLMLVTVPPELGEALVRVTVPPNATVPPPDNPDPATTLIEESASMPLVTPSAGILIVPVLLIGPPVKPAPVLMLVTVPPELGEALVRVTVPPNATVPPPDNPDPASTLMEESASMLFVTPSAGMLMVPLLVIGPPVRPGASTDAGDRSRDRECLPGRESKNPILGDRKPSLGDISAHTVQQVQGCSRVRRIISRGLSLPLEDVIDRSQQSRVVRRSLKV